MSNQMNQTLAKSVQIARSYQRSIRLDADYGRVDALEGYICHGTARAVLSNLAKQLLLSNQRAFTWTGPYGGGKSSLALTLCSALSKNPILQAKARSVLKIDSLPIFDQALPVGGGGWLVIPVVGRRGSVVQEIAKSLARVTDQPEPKAKVSANAIIRTLTEISATEPQGVLLVIDEMGKFLESSATGGDDVYFFQELAEAAARSNGQFIVIGILHQSFKQYASKLGMDSRDEWAKVQGRYADIPLVAASDEIVELVGKAIQTDVKHEFSVPVSIEIADAIRRKRPTIGDKFWESLDKCWPLHPTMASLLGPVSKRQFGQNERSTFGFLSSVEPYGFQAFLNEVVIEKNTSYRPHHYWDFLKANLEPAILASSDGHRWSQAAEAVERTESRGTKLHTELIKNIAIIDLFRNGSGLVAEDVVLRSLHKEHSDQTIKQALNDLSKWRIAVFRKYIGSWSVFEGSDFDIDIAVSEARSTYSELNIDRLMQLANLYPIVAKRHYFLKGTLRWMSVALCQSDNLEGYLDKFQPTGSEFGQFVLILPRPSVSIKKIIKDCNKYIQTRTSKSFPVVLGVPTNHILINELGMELLALEWVHNNRPELEGDSVARREVLARTVAIRFQLQEALREAFMQASWIGLPEKISGQLKLSSFASKLADDIYDKSPYLMNELVNRDLLSSNSVKARRDLLYKILKNEKDECLGIEGYPAERGLYESLLKSTNLHCQVGSNEWRFITSSDESNTFAPLWKKTKELLTQSNDRVSVQDIYSTWSDKPYGVRSGVQPILLMTYIQAEKETIAVYKDGMFVPELSEVDIDECLQSPARFKIQWIEKSEERALILNGISNLLAKLNLSSATPDPLETARALVSMVIKLPKWVSRTRRLSNQACSVRDVLLKASDPNKVLFVDLMKVLNISSGKEYVEALSSPILELMSAYDNLLTEISQRMLQELGVANNEFAALQQRATAVIDITGDLRFDAFASRLRAYEGSREDIEGILSLAAELPPTEWSDREINISLITIAEWALRFKQVEALVSVQNRRPTREAFAVVIGAGSSSKTLSKIFDITEQEKPIVENLASIVLEKIANQGLKQDLLLAALAEAGMKIIDGQKGL